MCCMDHNYIIENCGYDQLVYSFHALMHCLLKQQGQSAIMLQNSKVCIYLHTDKQQFL